MASTSIAWTFGKNARPYQRQRLTKKYTAPGPGAYDVSGKGVVTAAQPCFSIGTGKREGATGPVKAMAIVPGPGQYEAGMGPIEDKNGRSMGKKLKGMLDQQLGSNQPGPGHYTYTQVNKSVSGGMFGVRPQSAHVKKTNLGPGSYEILGDFDRSTMEKAQKGKLKTSRGTFGTSQRSKMQPLLAVPGPGQYAVKNYDFAKSHGGGFGSSVRGDITGNKKLKVPGPGQYTQKTRSNSQGCTIAQRHGTSMGPKSTVDVPGPGQYNPDIGASKMNAQTSIIGSEKRPDITGGAKGTKDWPGPGQHTLNGSIALNKGSKIGNSQRSQIGGNKRLNTPGPGNYSMNTNATLVQQPKYTIKGGKLRGYSHKMSDEPGPGQYSVKPMEKEGRVRIGSEKRSDIGGGNIGAIPGPGKYNVDKYSLSHSYGFGHAERKTLDQKKMNTPGPGQYMIPSHVGQLNTYQMPVSRVN